MSASVIGTRSVPRYRNGTSDAMSSPYGSLIKHHHEDKGVKAMLTPSSDLPLASPVIGDAFLCESQITVKKRVEKITEHDY
jgi:hypothetical protein